MHIQPGPTSDTARAMPGEAELERAAALLAAGQLVAFPTETVYGLGADAENPPAVARIYAAKERPANYPVIVHVTPEADLAYWAAAVPDSARRLIDAFWPGPLTLILRRAAHIADAVSGGQDTIGLRCPSHPVALALLRRFHGGRGGVAGPSANRFGRVSPTTAQHVRDEFGAGLYVLDGGPCEIGIESTIVDLSRGFPALLRPGHVGVEQMVGVLGEPMRLPGQAGDSDAPRASGTLKAHYAPSTPLALLSCDELIKALAQPRDGTQRIAAVISRESAGRLAATSGIEVVIAPDRPDVFAHELYRLLRELDTSGVACILIERPPQGPEWRALNDRLGRAAAAFPPEPGGLARGAAESSIGQ